MSGGTLLGLIGACALLAGCAVAVVCAQASRLVRARALRLIDEAHASFGRIVSSLDEHLYAAELLADGRYRPLYAGPGLATLLGAGRHVRHPLRSFVAAIHPDDREIAAGVLAAMRAGRPHSCEYRVVGADGEVRWVRERARPRPASDGRLVFDGIVTDVTAMRRAHDELRAALALAEQANRELERARAEAEYRSSIDELTSAYNRRHLRLLLEQTLADAADAEQAPALVMIDVDHFKRINDGAGHHVGDAVLIEVARRLSAAAPAGACVARWGGEEFCVLLAAVQGDEALREAAEAIRLAIAAEPFAADGDGVLDVTVSVGAASVPGDTASASVLLQHADRALYAAKRRGRNQVCLARDLRSHDLVAEDPGHVQLAKALALAASLREGMPELHCQQVAELSARVALRLGLPARRVLACQLGGLLHDVGKVAIPDRVLSKPGALSEADAAVMRRHPVIGEQLLRRVGGLEDAAAAVRHHHERLDGSGYPDGLAGELIPLEARIVAAADAYSAMTSPRVYGRGRSSAEGRAELRRAAGSHFDPAVVEALESVLDAGTEAIAAELRDRRSAA